MTARRVPGTAAPSGGAPNPPDSNPQYRDQMFASDIRRQFPGAV
jgi:hypothetical protein